MFINSLGLLKQTNTAKIKLRFIQAYLTLQQTETWEPLRL
jgi:hypothetical protein